MTTQIEQNIRPNALRGLLALAGFALLTAYGCSRSATRRLPVTTGDTVTQFQSLTSGSVDLGEGLEISEKRGSWIRLAKGEDGLERWINLDGLSSLSVR